MNVLVLEDGTPTRDALVAALLEAGHSVEEARTSTEARGSAQTYTFDALLLDVSLPEGERAGFEVARSLSEAGVTTSVLFLTGRGGLSDLVAGFDVGGDNYLLKPYRLTELLVRLRTQARRTRSDSRPILEYGDLRLDWNRRQISRRLCRLNWRHSKLRTGVI